MANLTGMQRPLEPETVILPEDPAKIAHNTEMSGNGGTISTEHKYETIVCSILQSTMPFTINMWHGYVWNQNIS